MVNRMKPPKISKPIRKPRSDCPINMALETLGDGWTLLIVRDLMFKKRNTFKAFLEAEENIASNVLTDRLRRLEQLGIATKRANPDDARSYIYRLTERGIELAPMLIELVLWSARHFHTAAPPEVLHQMANNRKQFLQHVRKDWEAANKR